VLAEPGENMSLQSPGVGLDGTGLDESFETGEPASCILGELTVAEYTLPNQASTYGGSESIQVAA
jgi:hypothetical protein